LRCIATWGRPTPRQSSSALITTSRVKFEVAQPIRCRLIAFLLLILYVTLCLHIWPCDLDLWSLTLNICSIPAVMQSNSVPNWSAIEQSAAELLRFQYNVMTLNMFHVLRTAYDNFYHVNLVNLSVPHLYRFSCCWYVMSHCDLDLWSLHLEHV